jgi:hypothetical protein
MEGVSASHSSVKKAFTTRSVTPVLSLPRFGATASISSKKRIHGRAALASSNFWRTFCSLAPESHITCPARPQRGEYRPACCAELSAGLLCSHLCIC